MKMTRDNRRKTDMTPRKAKRLPAFAAEHMDPDGRDDSNASVVRRACDRWLAKRGLLTAGDFREQQAVYFSERGAKIRRELAAIREQHEQ